MFRTQFCYVPLSLRVTTLIALLGFGAQTCLMAQSVTVDLTSPMLKANADLPRFSRAGRTLSAELDEARSAAASRKIQWKGLEYVVSDSDNIAGFTADGAQRFYKKRACAADAIVIGHSSASASHLSTFGSVYTDNVLSIDAVLLDNQSSSIAKASTIVVTRPGGSVVVNGDPVSFRYRSSPELKSTDTYLQFLQYIPASSAFIDLDAYSTLKRDHDSLLLFRNGSNIAVTGLTFSGIKSTISGWRNNCP